MKEKLRNVIFKVSPDVKDETLKEIKRMAKVLNIQDYTIIEEKPRYGWNSLIPTTTHKEKK